MPTDASTVDKVRKLANELSKIRESISFELPQAGSARLEILDLAGRRVKTLKDGWVSQGRHTVYWDGRDSRGNGMPSGQYFYRLSVGSVTETRKMQLVK